MRKIILCVCLLSCFSSSAQGDEKMKKDEAYVEKIKSLFSIRPYVNQNLDLLMMNYNKSDEAGVIYRPATGMNIGGEVAFSFLHFNYQKNLPYLQPSLPGGFNASHQRIGFDMGGKIFGVMMSFQQNRGFYVYNSGVIPDSGYADRDAVVFREDVYSKTFGLDARFTFSNKLSPNAIFDQSERQLKSKGSLSIIMGYRYNIFHGATPFVPEHLQPKYDQSATMRTLWSNTIHFLPGYGYIAAKGYWNIGAFLYSGTGIQIRRYTNADDEKTGLKFPMVLRGKLGVSYNGKYFYAKLAANLDMTSLGMKDANFNWMQSYWEFSVGLRLYKKKK
jgi:hypothetical protein